MTTHEVDVVVLGLGPGGEHAAIKLGRAGLDVVAVDERLVGGECPYFGCVPSKMMIAAARELDAARRVPEFGGTAEVHPDWGPVAARIRDEATDDWDDTAAVKRLEDAGATFVRGHGVLTGPGRVEVDGTTYAARRGVVLNTGTSPAVPPVDGLADTPYWTNRDAVRLTELPASLAVLGGGPIGAELAQVFSRFGVRVTVVEAADRLLPNDEPEAGEKLEAAFAAEGIQVLTGAAVSQVAYADGAFTLAVGDGEVTADKLLVATGRRTHVEGIGLGVVGATVERGVVATDERMRAGERLWAVGDITGKGAFTHVSMYQAAVAVRDVLGQDGPWADYRSVSRVTFTEPEVASAGMSEARAHDELPNVAVATGDLGSRGWIAKADGLVKVVADADRKILVGATVVGPTGGEVIGLLGLAIKQEVPVTELLELHYAYPTYYRAVEAALKGLLDDLGA
ncbi:NAD(P)/FAD-dependent oxidoreductase [Nocardioides guangzhouensis]|uniref:NAD(P)/FAD-dependent oxidoreductase n=1 Tax=Nocardioides guangzhouensis TaxID=2497878 RepID=A0A4V1XZA6_9ACTN|nr:NAD(P)/FAD-dependent oxidoreductase [Nocardioides guangzhouensis]RYP86079.1 NAD(P)/FAD-dependent oxidoreductase [Nocardioides guangzhouensis]